MSIDSLGGTSNAAFHVSDLPGRMSAVGGSTPFSASWTCSICTPPEVTFSGTENGLIGRTESFFKVTWNSDDGPAPIFDPAAADDDGVNAAGAPTVTDTASLVNVSPNFAGPLADAGDAELAAAGADDVVVVAEPAAPQPDTATTTSATIGTAQRTIMRYTLLPGGMRHGRSATR